MTQVLRQGGYTWYPMYINISFPIFLHSTEYIMTFILQKREMNLRAFSQCESQISNPYMFLHDLFHYDFALKEYAKTLGFNNSVFHLSKKIHHICKGSNSDIQSLVINTGFHF